MGMTAPHTLVYFTLCVRLPFFKCSHRNARHYLKEALFMARPKKEAEQKFEKLIMLRLTDTQYEIVCEYARMMGLPPAVYARQVITEGRHPINCNIVRDDETIDSSPRSYPESAITSIRSRAFFIKAVYLHPELKQSFAVQSDKFTI